LARVRSGRVLELGPLLAVYRQYLTLLVPLQDGKRLRAKFDVENVVQEAFLRRIGRSDGSAGRRRGSFWPGCGRSPPGCWPTRCDTTTGRSGATSVCSGRWRGRPQDRIYSVGATLYELLTLRTAFHARNCPGRSPRTSRCRPVNSSPRSRATWKRWPSRRWRRSPPAATPPPSVCRTTFAGFSTKSPSGRGDRPSSKRRRSGRGGTGRWSRRPPFYFPLDGGRRGLLWAIHVYGRIHSTRCPAIIRPPFSPLDKPARPGVPPLRPTIQEGHEREGAGRWNTP